MHSGVCHVLTDMRKPAGLFSGIPKKHFHVSCIGLLVAFMQCKSKASRLTRLWDCIMKDGSYFNQAAVHDIIEEKKADFSCWSH